MLTKVTLGNFRCFEEAEAPLRGLTVLIGKNDTGKSALLDGPRALGEGSLDPARDPWHIPTPPRLVLIEEPEKGVHPGRLADIVGLLRRLTESAPEPAQVVLSNALAVSPRQHRREEGPGADLRAP